MTHIPVELVHTKAQAGELVAGGQLGQQRCRGTWASLATGVGDMQLAKLFEGAVSDRPCSSKTAVAIVPKGYT